MPVPVLKRIFTTDHNLQIIQDNVQAALTALAGSSVGVTRVISSNLTNGAYTVKSSDEILLVDTSAKSVSINLLKASNSSGQVLRIKKVDSSANTVTVLPSSQKSTISGITQSDTIDGATSMVLSSQYEQLAITSDGQFNWDVLSHYLAGGSLTNPMTTLGDLIYGGASGTPTRLAGNTSATQKFFAQTGTGSASAIPGWVALSPIILSQGTVTPFTSSGTFTTPSSSSTSTVYSYVCVGGGGGGGGANNSSACAGGGGSSGVSFGTFTGLAASASVTITVGTGGAGGVSSSSNGQSGGTSSIAATGITTITANGGSGAQSQAGATVGSGASGGTATGGTVNFTGGSGFNGVTAATSAGAGGSNLFGQGGAPAAAFITGTGGGGRGAGGGGGGSLGVSATGGRGADGIVIITQVTP